MPQFPSRADATIRASHHEMPCLERVSKTLHQRVVLLVAPGLGGELLEPFAKSSIQRLAPSASDGSGPFDQILVRAQCNVLHSTLVYTIFVQTPTIFGLPIA